MPAAERKFFVRKCFNVNDDEKAEVKIRYLNDIFINKLYSKIELFKPKRTVRRHKLLMNIIDKSMVIRLGGEEIAVTTLQDVWHLIKMQGKGEKGHLLTNGKVNIFFIYDENKEIMVLSLDWNEFGWGIEAFSTELHALECESDSQLFSH